MFRVGIGYDLHPIAPGGDGRRLVIGGVEFPGERGLKGHSDADVLLHSICDAVLGALGLGDLGGHFPDDDPALAGISSLILLERIAGLMKEKGYGLVNLDAVVIAQRPPIAPRADGMRSKIAAAMGADPATVNIKATSPEGVGSLGAGGGIAAQAVVLLGKI